MGQGLFPVQRGYPDPFLESKYEPLYGFPRGRKLRMAKATEVEMDSAKIEGRWRDYCADKMIKLKACRRDNTPFFYRCNAYVHAWEECEWHDSIMRMKDYERERRLDERQKRILNRMKQEE